MEWVLSPCTYSHNHGWDDEYNTMVWWDRDWDVAHEQCREWDLKPIHPQSLPLMRWWWWVHPMWWDRDSDVWFQLPTQTPWYYPCVPCDDVHKHSKYATQDTNTDKKPLYKAVEPHLQHTTSDGWERSPSQHIVKGTICSSMEISLSASPNP